MIPSSDTIDPAEFAAALRTGITSLGGADAIRDAYDDPTQLLTAHRTMMNELGLPGLLIAEEHDGLDSTMTAATALGRIAGTAPAADILGPYVLAPAILELVHSGPVDDDARTTAAQLLTAITSGEATATVSFDGLVFDAAHTTHMIVLHEGALQIAPTAQLSLTPLPAFDPTRPIHRIDPVSVLGSDILATGELAAQITETALTAGRIYLAAELEGTARTMLNDTVAHLRERIAFGRPLGSFQALKHQIADMWSEVSLIGPLVDEAARTFDTGTSTQEAALYATAALSFAADTATRVCEQGLQLHGGIGYTWESTVHLHLKRAAANRVRLGTPHTLRAELAALTDI